MTTWYEILMLTFIFLILCLSVPPDEPVDKEWEQLDLDFEGKNDDN